MPISTSISSNHPSARKKRLSFSQTAAKAGIAAVLAAIGNALLYVIGSLLGAFPETVIIPNANAPMTIVPVLLVSVVTSVIGVIVYALINNLKIFSIVAAVVFVLMFVTPFSIPDAPVSMVVFLELMHVLPAAAVLWVASRK